MSNFALRFISGKYEGGEFPLRPDREIVIGRSSDLDVVLVEDMVSRKHAKISTMADEIAIMDLGSTNGTFVNGEKVTRTKLKQGDRILVGTSIIKLVAIEQGAVSDESEAEARAKLQEGAARRSSNSGSRTMSGSIAEIPLPDLIQLLSTSRKDGVLSVRTDQSLGKIYLRAGQIYYVSIDDNFTLQPRKSMFRLLTWEEGGFELGPPEDRQVMEEISETTEMLLMEGMRQLDELRHMGAKAPPTHERLGVPAPLSGKLRDLSPEELDVFQLVIDYGHVGTLLDHYPGTDLEAYQALAKLIKQEFVAVQGATSSR